MNIKDKKLSVRMSSEGTIVTIEDVGDFSLRDLVEHWWLLREAEAKRKRGEEYQALSVPAGVEIARTDGLPIGGLLPPGKYTFMGEEGSETRKQYEDHALRQAEEETEPEDLPDDAPPTKTEFDADTIRAEAQSSTFRMMYGAQGGRQDTMPQAIGAPYGTSSIGVGDHVPRFQFEHCGETHTYIREDHVRSLLSEKAERERGMYDVPAGAYVCYATFKDDGDARDFQHCLWHDKTSLEPDETRVKGYFVPFDYSVGNLTDDMVRRGAGVLQSAPITGGTPEDLASRVYSAMDLVRPIKTVEDEWRNALKFAMDDLGVALDPKDDPKEVIDLLLRAQAAMTRAELEIPQELPSVDRLAKILKIAETGLSEMERHYDERDPTTPQVTAYFQGLRNAYRSFTDLLRSNQ